MKKDFVLEIVSKMNGLGASIQAEISKAQVLDGRMVSSSIRQYGWIQNHYDSSSIRHESNLINTT